MKRQRCLAYLAGVAISVAALIPGSRTASADIKYMKGRTAQTYAEWGQRTDTPSKAAKFFEEHMQVNNTKPCNNLFEPLDNLEPLETYRRGGGSDLDNAVLASAWLSQHGYDSRVVLVKDAKGLNTAFCAVKEKTNGKWDCIRFGYSVGSDGWSSIDEAFPDPTALSDQYSVTPNLSTPFGYMSQPNRFASETPHATEPNHITGYGSIRQILDVVYPGWLASGVVPRQVILQDHWSKQSVLQPVVSQK